MIQQAEQVKQRKAKLSTFFNMLMILHRLEYYLGALAEDLNLFSSNAQTE
jgi:hypothetical protein